MGCQDLYPQKSLRESLLAVAMVYTQEIDLLKYWTDQVVMF